MIHKGTIEGEVDSEETSMQCCNHWLVLVLKKAILLRVLVGLPREDIHVC